MNDFAGSEPKRPSRVDRESGGGGLLRRVAALEGRMTLVEACSKEAAENSRELLAIVTATKGVGAFFKKHGGRLVAFGIGSLAASGVLGETWAGLLRGLFLGI